jgi:mannan endo-1,4-beta-mannosidase
VPNYSANSTVMTVTALPDGGAGTCRVAYTVHDWGGADVFTASVTITNTGQSAINGWTLAFSFPAGQRLTDSWSANWSQPAGGANVTATNMPWNSTIAPGASVGVGFNATHAGANPPPTAFTLNGVPCAIA